METQKELKPTSFIKCNGEALRVWLARQNMHKQDLVTGSGVGRMSVINACRGLAVRKYTFDKLEAYVGKGNI